MSTSPLLVVNGLFLDHPHTGTGVYTREVLARLLHPDRETQGAPANDWRVQVVGHPEHRDLFGPVTPPYLARQGLPRTRASKLEKVWWEQAILPLTTRRLGADLLYAPYFSLPLFSGAPGVVTVHDLVPLVLPEYAPSAPFKAYFKLVAAATRRAAAVVTDSAHSAHDITTLLDVPRERIHVVPLGVDARYSAPVTGGEIAALRAKLALPDAFMLYLGGIDPRKNTSVLLRALALLRDRGAAHLPLVFVGGRGGRFADPRHEAARLGLAGHVSFIEWVEDEDKPALYAAAAAFAYPSRYEGFGLPPLEAMAAGTPVLCADASSLPEVVGDAALTLDPDDVDAWADAWTRIGDDAALRARLAEAGRLRAAAFTWDATVAGLRAVFAQALAPHR